MFSLRLAASKVLSKGAIHIHSSPHFLHLFPLQLDDIGGFSGKGYDRRMTT